MLLLLLLRCCCFSISSSCCCCCCCLSNSSSCCCEGNLNCCIFLTTISLWKDQGKTCVSIYILMVIQKLNFLLSQNHIPLSSPRSWRRSWKTSLHFCSIVSFLKRGKSVIIWPFFHKWTFIFFRWTHCLFDEEQKKSQTKDFLGPNNVSIDWWSGCAWTLRRVATPRLNASAFNIALRFPSSLKSMER